MAVAALVILVPVLLALGELARLDRAARRLQFGAQRPVIATAMAENADPSFRLIPIETQVRVSMRPEIHAVLGGKRASVTLRRCYWIATGSGHGETDD